MSDGLLDLHLDPEEFARIRTSRQIVVGDFNGLWQVPSGKPFSTASFEHAGIPTRVSRENPPITCCLDALPWSSYGTGDFIFDSKSIALPATPTA